jgi:hypothetical protein
MAQIVMLYGYARAGKDTLADGIIQGAKNEVWRCSFAKSLKFAVNIAVREFIDNVDYDVEADKLQDRNLLVEFGKAVRRRDPMAFAKRLCYSIGNPSTGREHHVITDARYFNEYQFVAEWAKSHGYALTTVFVWRDGNTYANIEERDSIDEVLRNIAFDYVIDGAAYDADNVRKEGIELAKTLNL